jgi:hypothetical protein
VVVRDLFLGKRKYGDFQSSPERIPTNILAEWPVFKVGHAISPVAGVFLPCDLLLVMLCQEVGRAQDPI